MQDLCPLCLKNGFKKKIKLLQINLQEAVWMCEEEKCTWPFGCKDFVFYPRLVGKIWSCYWDNNAPLRLKENGILSVKPSICNESVTSAKDASRECVDSILGTNSPEDINGINNDLNIIDSKSANNDLRIPNQKEPSTPVSVNTEEKYNVNNSTLNQRISDSSSNDINLQLDIDKIKNKDIETERVNSSNKSVKEEDISTGYTTNVNNVKRIPKITSIEKTNIDISNVKASNEISLCQDKNKNLSKSGELPKLDPPKHGQLINESTVKPNLNVTMMKIDGLPPITLSFEMPVSGTTETVMCNLQRTDCRTTTTKNTVCSNIKSCTSDIKSTSAKRNVTGGKLYEKFSFSAIKKKMETKNSNDVNGNSNNSLNTKTDPKIKDVENDSIGNTKKSNCIENHDNRSNVISNEDSKQITPVPNVTDTSTLNQVNNCEFSLPSQEDISNNQETISDTSLNISASIDTVLTDFLTNDYSVSEDINDDWLNSLLN